METKFLKQSKINFSKEVNNYYPEILTDEAFSLMPFTKI
jgi:malate synthase